MGSFFAGKFFFCCKFDKAGSRRSAEQDGSE